MPPWDTHAAEPPWDTLHLKTDTPALSMRWHSEQPNSCFVHHGQYLIHAYTCHQDGRRTAQAAHSNPTQRAVPCRAPQPGRPECSADCAYHGSSSSVLGGRSCGFRHETWNERRQSPSHLPSNGRLNSRSAFGALPPEVLAYPPQTLLRVMRVQQYGPHGAETGSMLFRAAHSMMSPPSSQIAQ